MLDDKIRNSVTLCGTPLSEPVFSHENHGRRFFRFPLSVARLSGQTDTLPILVSAGDVPLVQVEQPLTITGQLRSYNNKCGIGSRLVLSVLALELSADGDTPENQIFLSGHLCKPPVLRQTPLGRWICDVMLAVSRRYGRSDYLPVISWGQLAREIGQYQVGDPLSLQGRIQSRQYRKITDNGPEEHTAYEVSIMKLLEYEET